MCDFERLKVNQTFTVNGKGLKVVLELKLNHETLSYIFNILNIIILLLYYYHHSTSLYLSLFTITVL